MPSVQEFRPVRARRAPPSVWHVAGCKELAARPLTRTQKEMHGNSSQLSACGWYKFAAGAESAGWHGGGPQPLASRLLRVDIHPAHKAKHAALLKRGPGTRHFTAYTCVCHRSAGSRRTPTSRATYALCLTAPTRRGRSAAASTSARAALAAACRRMRLIPRCLLPPQGYTICSFS